MTTWTIQKLTLAPQLQTAQKLLTLASVLTKSTDSSDFPPPAAE